MRSVFFLLVASTLAFSAVGCAASSEEDDSNITGSGEDNLTSQDRSAIMDSLRAKVKPDLANQDIVFNVSQGALRVESNFAWLQGKVQLRNGGEPTTNGTVYAGDEGLFDGWHIEALLQKKNGSWTVLESGIGSTDVWWWGIDENYPQAPKSIFPYLDGQATQEVAPAERRAIMDGLRAVVKPDAGNQDIVFNVQGEFGMFAAKDGYAWLMGDVQLRGGGEPSLNGTEWEGNEGMFDGWHIQALLKKQGNSWTVLEHAVGATDVWFQGLADRYPEVPKAILPEVAGGTRPSR